MTDCEMLSRCPFFNDKMEDMPALSKIYKEKYCKTDNFECARYLIMKIMGKEKVPADLFPNMLDKAKIILEENKKL